MKKLFFIFVVSFIFSPFVYAQTFDEDMGVPKQIKTTTETKTETVKKTTDDVKKFFMPTKAQEKTTPTQKGSSTIKRIYGKNEKPKEDEFPNVVFLSMDNFKVSRVGSITTCSMRFTILTNFVGGINNIDMRLTWPEIMTTLSFEGLIPNQPTYLDYALLGDGCYTMDKVPNIEVNRCRAKGMSQQQCSDVIMWIK